MTLNERFVGGNPRILLFLFCLFCVVLICFVGICPTMMRKSENFLKPLTKNQTHHILEKTKKKKIPSKKKKNTFFFQKVGTGRANPSDKKKKKFFFSSSPFIHQHKHLSFLKQPSTTSIAIKPSNLHISLNFPPNHKNSSPKQFKTTFIHPNQNSPKFLYPINLTQPPQILHQPTPLNS